MATPHAALLIEACALADAERRARDAEAPLIAIGAAAVAWRRRPSPGGWDALLGAIDAYLSAHLPQPTTEDRHDDD